MCPQPWVSGMRRIPSVVWPITTTDSILLMHIISSSFSPSCCRNPLIFCTLPCVSSVIHPAFHPLTLPSSRYLFLASPTLESTIHSLAACLPVRCRRTWPSLNWNKPHYSLKLKWFFTAKFSLYLINHHTMKEFGRMEVQLHTFLFYGLSNDAVASNGRTMNWKRNWIGTVVG
jgi:hypothetical protein